MIVHHPLVITLGPLSLSGYGVALALALALALLVIRREFARCGIAPEALEDIVVVSLVGLAGAKAYDVATGGALWWARGGFSMVGGLLVVPPTAWWLARKRGLRFEHLADPLTLGITAAIPVARTGCWAIGDDYGRPLDASWAVAFPAGAPPSTAANLAQRFNEGAPGLSADTVVAVHPTQLYEAAIGVVVFAWLWQRRNSAPPLATFFAGVGATAASRFVVEFVRAKSDRLDIGLTITQLVCAGVLVVCVWMARRWTAHAVRSASQNA